MALSRDHRVVFIGLLALASSAAFILFFSSPLPWQDAVQYDRLAYNIAAGHGYSLSAAAPFSPTMFREPAYPFFLALIYKIFGHSTRCALFAQAVLHALTAMLSYFMAKDAFSEGAGLISGVFVAVFPALANMPAYIMSETFFTFMLALAVYIYSRAIKGGRAGWFVMAGIAFAIASLTKAVSILLPLLLVSVTLAASALKKRFTKGLAIRLLCFLIIFAAVLLPWAFRNKARFNTYSITFRSGELLWSRAEKIDDPLRIVLASACYNFSEYLGHKIFPDVTDRPERYLYKDFDRAQAIRKEYADRGYAPDQIDGIFQKEAARKISGHPFRYLSYTFVEGIKMTAFTYLPLLNEAHVAASFNDHYEDGVFKLSLLKGIARLLAYPFIIMSLIGIVKNISVSDRWIVLFAVILYFNLIYSLLDAIGRYALPLIPFYCIFAAAAFFPARQNNRSI